MLIEIFLNIKKKNQIILPQKRFCFILLLDKKDMNIIIDKERMKPA